MLLVGVLSEILWTDLSHPVRIYSNGPFVLDIINARTKKRPDRRLATPDCRKVVATGLHVIPIDGLVGANGDAAASALAKGSLVQIRIKEDGNLI